LSTIDNSSRPRFFLEADVTRLFVPTRPGWRLVWLAGTAALTTSLSAAPQRPAAAAAGAQPCSGGALDPTCRAIGTPAVPLPAGPVVFETAEQKMRVVVITKELAHPWSLAFLPNGDMLVTERPGRLRLVSHGTLDPQPIGGVPRVHAAGLLGLLDIAPHPRFAETRLVYLSYSKPVENGRFTTALARATLEGRTLVGLREIFVAEPNAGGASRIAFGKDGTLFMTVAGAGGTRAQDPNDIAGKVLRFKDDGSIPDDNPFVGRAGHRPEVYSLGHRSNVGLAVHPETGAVWTTENGPNGGDEINVVLPGRNYGWPIVSYGRTYQGPRVSEVPWRAAMEQPIIFWVPSIAVTGIAFYTGDRFPGWKGNVFVGGLRTGEIPRTGHIERIAFNAKGEEMRRESLLTEFQKRIRDVRQGPDGLLYVLAEDEPTADAGEGALLRIEPVQ
jgi:glucose/arabinose dehydrogenase